MEYASSLVIAILLGITLVTLSAEVRTKPRIIFPDLGDSVSALGSPSGSPAKWDYLRFARYWPMSFCLLSKVKYSWLGCHVPQNVSAFTIHGLWPTVKWSDLKWCNWTIPFHEDKIKPIEGVMEKEWPTLWTNTRNTDLWIHEWDKHGTCGIDLPAISDEYKYFSTGLKLNQKYNITRYLSTYGIEPSSNNTYQYIAIMGALEDGLLAKPEIQCYIDTADNQYLFQVVICIGRSLEVINCPPATWYLCNQSLPIILPPITHQPLYNRVMP